MIFRLQIMLYQWFRAVEKKLLINLKVKDADIGDELFTNFSRKINYLFENTRSVCITQSYAEPDANGKWSTAAWAMRYNHRDSLYSNQRKWLTEVGIRQISSEVCIVHVLLRYEADKHLLIESEYENTPIPTIPNFVKNLIKSDRYIVSLDEKFILSCLKSPLVVTSAEWLNSLFVWLHDLRRKSVVIILNGTKNETLAHALHTQLSGKVVVVVLADSDEMQQCMRESSNEHFIPYNGMRIFYPQEGSSRMSGYNRWFYPEEIESNLENIIRNMLSVYEIRNAAAVHSIDEVRNLITVSNLKHKINLLQLRDEAEETENQEGTDEHDIDYWKNLYEEEKLQNDEVLRLCFESDSKKEKAEQALYAKDVVIQDLVSKLDNASSIGRVLASMAYPKRLIDVVNFMEHMFPGRLVFLDSAKQSAENYSTYKALDIAWEMFVDIGVKLYNLKFREKNFNEREFKQLTRFDFSMKESATTQKNAALMREREVQYKDGVYNISPHLKYGVMPPKCLRIHIAFVESEGVILIGYVGDHMNTAGTRKI